MGAPKKTSSKKGKRASVVKRKVADGKGRLGRCMRHIAVTCAVVVIVLWVGAWFFLSDVDTRSYDLSIEKILAVSADVGFRVENILVEGRKYTDRDVLLALVNVQKGDPIFVFNPVTAKELIERMAWVKSAQVERRLPGTIYISLKERRPLALWKQSGTLVLVGEEGQVLADRNLTRFSDLFLIAGEGAPENAADLIRLLDAEPDLRARIDSVHRIENRRWNIQFRDGTLIKLPAEDIGLVLRSLMVAQDTQGILDKNIKTIDLRDPARIVVRTELGRAMNIKASTQVAGQGESL